MPLAVCFSVDFARWRFACMLLNHVDKRAFRGRVFAERMIYAVCRVCRRGDRYRKRCFLKNGCPRSRLLRMLFSVSLRCVGRKATRVDHHDHVAEAVLRLLLFIAP